jgi:hypothetical protein
LKIFYRIFLQKVVPGLLGLTIRRKANCERIFSFEKREKKAFTRIEEIKRILWLHQPLGEELLKEGPICVGFQIKRTLF